MAGPVLILGGTAEARRLAELLDAKGHRVITSLAGRTAAPAALPGAVRSGGFGGPAGLAAYLREAGVAALADATHPYAARMGANAAAAAEAAGVPLLRLDRPPWQPEPGDRWHGFPDRESLMRGLPTLGRHALVTLGGADLAALPLARGIRITLRAIDRPDPMPDHPALALLLARGPFDEAAERALMAEHGIDVLVSRNAGGTATRAKIDAARALGLPVAMLERPSRPGVPAETDPEAAARRIGDLLAS
jgi:precorrin-6A/cobalt-precorrin-6A reductase